MRLNTTLTMLLYVLNVSSNNIDNSVNTLHVIDYYPVNNNINNFTVSESDNVCGTDSFSDSDRATEVGFTFICHFSVIWWVY